MVPTTRYQGEGVYVIDQGDGETFLARVMTWTTRDEMRLLRRGCRTPPFFMSREAFNTCVLGWSSPRSR